MQEERARRASLHKPSIARRAKKEKVSTVLNMYFRTFLSAENAPTPIAGRPGQGMEILLPCGDVKADY